MWFKACPYWFYVVDGQRKFEGSEEGVEFCPRSLGSAVGSDWCTIMICAPTQFKTELQNVQSKWDCSLQFSKIDMLDFLPFRTHRIWYHETVEDWFRVLEWTSQYAELIKRIFFYWLCKDWIYKWTTLIYLYNNYS